MHRAVCGVACITLSVALALLGAHRTIAEDGARSAEENAARLPAPAAPGEFVLAGDEGFALALRLAIATRDFEAALRLLDLRPDLAGRPDAVRLRAQLLVELGREREALELLEVHLIAQPNDALARFLIAELHFARGRDQAATLAFQLALAGDLDGERVRLAQGRLDALKVRRQWRVWVGASVAPDSNYNGATEASRVNLFGLPFVLNDEARRRGGVSVSAFAGLERRMPLAGLTHLKIATLGSATDAPGTAFDDLYVSARVGPEWSLNARTSASVQASVSRRWFGGVPLEDDVGAWVEVELDGRSNTSWVASGGLESVDSHVSNGRDGWVGGVDVIRTRFLGPSALWRARGAVTRLNAYAAEESFTHVHVSAGRLLALPLATYLYVEPYGALRRHDEVSSAFRERRQDFEYGAELRFTRRDWTVLGAYPFVAVSVLRNESTIPLFEFSRERAQLGFTRTF